MRDHIFELLAKSNLGNDSNNNWYVAPDIPAKKLNKAILSYASHVVPEEVVALADGTMLGSGKAGMLLTATSVHTLSDGAAVSIPFDHIRGTSDFSKMTSSEITIHGEKGDVKIDSTFFDKKHSQLVSFFSYLSPCLETANKIKMESGVEIIRAAPEMANIDYSMTSEEASDKFNGIVFFGGDDHQDFKKALSSALADDREVPIVKGLCRYFGFGMKEVEGLFLISNKRCLLFSLESGTVIFTYALTKKLLSKVPLLGLMVRLLLIDLPYALFDKIFNYREKRTLAAFVLAEEDLLSGSSRLRKVQDFDFEKVSRYVKHIEIGNRIPTGILSSNVFGITFMQRSVTQAWTKPKDWILSANPELPPFTALIRSVLSELEAANISVEFEPKKIQLNLPSDD